MPIDELRLSPFLPFVFGGGLMRACFVKMSRQVATGRDALVAVCPPANFSVTSTLLPATILACGFIHMM
ncbi:MAG: hypothetical protein ACREFR_04155 [Limisphaerales bacterium]